MQKYANVYMWPLTKTSLANLPFARIYMHHASNRIYNHIQPDYSGLAGFLQLATKGLQKLQASLEGNSWQV